MKWVFDWKCSLYSLTVCLDSMSPFPFFFFFKSILLSFFSHILHQWYFLYLRITGQKEKHKQKSIAYTSAVREPGNGGERIQFGRGAGGRKSNDKLAFLWMILAFLEGKQLAQWDGKDRKYARLPLGLKPHTSALQRLSPGGGGLFRR